MSRRRKGANIGGAAVSATPERSQNSFSTPSSHCGIAEAEIFVADPLASGEQRICELQRVEAEIAVQRLEPFGRVARAVLKLEHFERAFGLILLERLCQRQVGAVEHFGQLDRILQRELGARADREMRGVRGVAEQDQFVVRPAFAFDPAELEPRRAAAADARRWSSAAGRRDIWRKCARTRRSNPPGSACRRRARARSRRSIRR